MKKLSLREFQRKASAHLKDMPIALTRYNKIFAVVTDDPMLKTRIAVKIKKVEEKLKQMNKSQN